MLESNLVLVGLAHREVVDTVEDAVTDLLDCCCGAFHDSQQRNNAASYGNSGCGGFDSLQAAPAVSSKEYSQVLLRMR
jgi:hypothetical protein